jgi:hypothetical protein
MYHSASRGGRLFFYPATPGPASENILYLPDDAAGATGSCPAFLSFTDRAPHALFPMRAGDTHSGEPFSRGIVFAAVPE